MTQQNRFPYFKVGSKLIFNPAEVDPNALVPP
jgi:hypothetical protein